MEDLFNTLSEITKPEPAILQHLESKAIRAHSNVSFSPEKRGEQMIKEYSEELTADIEELKAQGVSEESLTDYKARYERFFNSYLSAKSNCFSVMITGGSNFPVRRHEKTKRSEEKHYTIFREWRIRAKKAIVRKAQPEKTFLSEIDRYKKELAGMSRNHEIMKVCNAIIKKAKGNDCSALLITAGLSEKNAVEIQKPDYAGRIGFASFNLTNNNANMKRVEGRIKELEAKEQRATTTGQDEFTFDGFTVVYNHEADRIQVKHDAKPEQEVINGFKKAGFRWSYAFKAWQRNLNINGIIAAERLLNIKLNNIV